MNVACVEEWCDVGTGTIKVVRIFEVCMNVACVEEWCDVGT
jgi:hypothetical protein